MALLAMRIVGEISRGGDLVSNLVDALSGDDLNQFRYFRRMPQSQSTFGSEVSLETAPEGWCGWLVEFKGYCIQNNIRIYSSKLESGVSTIRDPDCSSLEEKHQFLTWMKDSGDAASLSWTNVQSVSLASRNSTAKEITEATKVATTKLRDYFSKENRPARRMAPKPHMDKSSGGWYNGGWKRHGGLGWASSTTTLERFGDVYENFGEYSLTSNIKDLQKAAKLGIYSFYCRSGGHFWLLNLDEAGAVVLPFESAGLIEAVDVFGIELSKLLCERVV